MAIPKGTPRPGKAINPQRIYSPEVISADLKIPLTVAQQQYVGKVTGQRLQAQADKYFGPGGPGYVPPVKTEEEPKQETINNIINPDIPDTTSYTGNISTYGGGAPSYVAPTKTAEELAAEAEAAAAAEERKNALDVLAQRYAQYGLSGLVDVIKKLAIEGASEATITFALQETPEYKERFKANAIRLEKGLAVLSPADYIAVEDSYRQVLRTYGLTQFDNDAYVSQFIANDMSPTELNSRVQMASTRILNANPMVGNILRDYYNITNTDLVAYTLDPKGQLPSIQKQISAAEIGAAAAGQGLSIGLQGAEYWAQRGVTQDQATKGYATIADILPTAQKLSDIYGTTLDAYGQLQAEQEVFGQLASEKRKREKLAAAETATFGGQSGAAKNAFSSNYSNRQSSAGQF